MLEDLTKNDPKKKKKISIYIYIYKIQNKIVSKTMRYHGRFGVPAETETADHYPQK